MFHVTERLAAPLGTDVKLLLPTPHSVTPAAMMSPLADASGRGGLTPATTTSPLDDASGRGGLTPATTTSPWNDASVIQSCGSYGRRP